MKPRRWRKVIRRTCCRSLSRAVLGVRRLADQRRDRHNEEIDGRDRFWLLACVGADGFVFETLPRRGGDGKPVWPIHRTVRALPAPMALTKLMDVPELTMNL